MLYLTKKQAEELIEHSKRESPNEACGILAGKEGRVNTSTSSFDRLRTSPERSRGTLSVNGERSRTVEKVYQMTNTDKSAQTFFMEPKEQLRVTKEIRNLKLQMVGIYHSHLETEAYPSAHDVELAYYPEASYVIVSIKDKGNPSIRSFKIDSGRIVEEEVRVE